MHATLTGGVARYVKNDMASTLTPTTTDSSTTIKNVYAYSGGLFSMENSGTIIKISKVTMSNTTVYTYGGVLNVLKGSSISIADSVFTKIKSKTTEGSFIYSTSTAITSISMTNTELDCNNTYYYKAISNRSPSSSSTPKSAMVFYNTMSVVFKNNTIHNCIQGGAITMLASTFSDEGSSFYSNIKILAFNPIFR